MNMNVTKNNGVKSMYTINTIAILYDSKDNT